MFAKPQGIGETWIIKKCPVRHSCRASATRTDHAQLTASIIADIIDDTIKKDVAASINHIADVVKMRLEQKSMSQRTFAKKNGVSPSRVSEYLSGKSEPTLRIARNISKILNIDSSIILGI